MDNIYHTNRLNSLRTALEKAGIQAAVLSRPQHVYYFTGFMPGPSPVLLLITAQKFLAVAPAPLPGVETLTYPDYDIHNGWDVTAAAVARLDDALGAMAAGHASLGLELDQLPAAYWRTAHRRAESVRDLKDLLWSIRKNKDDQELDQIERNVAGNDRVFAAVQSALRPGIPELEVWALVQSVLNDNAGGPLLLEGDLGVGPRGANPDAKPSDVKIAAGQAVFLDVYSCTAAYYADTARVFVLGEPDARQCEIHGLLRAALAAGEACLRPGMPARSVDAAVRGVIAAAGLGACFPHHSGHAYGLFQQERPYLIPAEAAPLEEGMILTLEPGIYIPGWGGMRLEGNYYLSAAGARRLDKFPDELLVC